jgi:hypothetical protein
MRGQPFKAAYRDTAYRAMGRLSTIYRVYLVCVCPFRTETHPIGLQYVESHGTPSLLIVKDFD